MPCQRLSRQEEVNAPSHAVASDLRLPLVVRILVVNFFTVPRLTTTESDQASLGQHQPTR